MRLKADPVQVDPAQADPAQAARAFPRPAGSAVHVRFPDERANREDMRATTQEKSGRKTQKSKCAPHPRTKKERRDKP